jgi:hypothetical protein
VQGSIPQQQQQQQQQKTLLFLLLLLTALMGQQQCPGLLCQQQLPREMSGFDRTVVVLQSSLSSIWKPNAAAAATDPGAVSAAGTCLRS